MGGVDFGDLRRTKPVSSVFGFDRGLPIDRVYIERFLGENSDVIHDRVLEVGDRSYTSRFGGAAVTQSDVLHAVEGSPGATIVADLTHATSIETDTFDCIIITQTLQFVYSIEAAVSEIHRILRPGGTVLCTVPGISQISRYDMNRWGDYWRLTDLSARTLFETSFRSEDVSVTTYGNVLAATAFLHGIAASELSPDELEVRDPDYQINIAVRATKR